MFLEIYVNFTPILKNNISKEVKQYRKSFRDFIIFSRKAISVFLSKGVD